MAEIFGHVQFFGLKFTVLSPRAHIKVFYQQLCQIGVLIGIDPFDPTSVFLLNFQLIFFYPSLISNIFAKYFRTRAGLCAPIGSRLI